MLKHLTFAFSAALLSACTVVSDDTDGNSNSNSNSATDTNNTSGTTGSGTTTDGTTNPTTGTTTGGTTNPTTGTTGEEPTTGMTTTAATTIGTMTTTGSTGEDTEATTGGDTETTGGADYGNCGWNVQGFYACLDMGGVPGVEDPMMQDPIACPQDIMEGAACDDMGMGGIGSVGCCTPEGVNYFCDIEGNKKVFKDDCAM